MSFLKVNSNWWTFPDVNIEEEREPKSPLTAGLFREEMVTNWVRRKSMDISNGQLSGIEKHIRLNQIIDNLFPAPHFCKKEILMQLTDCVPQIVSDPSSAWRVPAILTTAASTPEPTRTGLRISLKNI